MKSHSSWNTCVPLRRDGWPAGMCLLWEEPLLMYGASAKGRGYLKFILLRNVSLYLGCLLHNTKQKTSPLSKGFVPCTSQAVAFPWNRYFHSMSMFPQSKVRAVVSVPEVCSICFPVFPSPSRWEEAGLCTDLVTLWFQHVAMARVNIWTWAANQFRRSFKITKSDVALTVTWFYSFLLSAAIQVVTA